VNYESLREELQVGTIYIRHFLDAGDSFLRGLQNPTHIVLFEKLFRRVLVNVSKNPQLSILCSRSLTRLYSVCKDIIGGFDDMILIVKLLDEAGEMELQHLLLDLLELLSTDDSNLHQLLDKVFVGSIIKYASLAHLNPDQIGNVLARATNQTLMLKETSDNPNPSSSLNPSLNPSNPNFSSNPYSSPNPGPGLSSYINNKENIEDKNLDRSPVGPVGYKGVKEKAIELKRSLWIPEDSICPKVWYIASLPLTLTQTLTQTLTLTLQCGIEPP
jgi:hypothetical protein